MGLVAVRSSGSMGLLAVGVVLPFMHRNATVRDRTEAGFMHKGVPRPIAPSSRVGLMLMQRSARPGRPCPVRRLNCPQTCTKSKRLIDPIEAKARK